MVTVEAAVALCAFVTVFAMVLAGDAARLVARGEQSRAPDAVHQIAAGATLSITLTGDEIRVTVRDPAADGLLPGVHVHAEAYAVREPDADDPTATPPTATDQMSVGGLTNRSPTGSNPPSQAHPAGQRPIANPARPQLTKTADRPRRPTEGDRR
jgi:hypothetical protein